MTFQNTENFKLARQKGGQQAPEWQETLESPKKRPT
jgi:hypothetical protein